LLGLAEDLDVQVSVNADLGSGGRWRRHLEEAPLEPRLWGDEGRATREVVELRRDMTGLARRFALAHELGHAILDRYPEKQTADLPVNEQERFASAFAAELLLAGLEESARERFRETQDALDLLDLANSVGVPPRILLLRAARDNWLAGLDVLWLDIQTIPNLETGRDRRPRIFRTVCDRDRWFLPRNRSVHGALGGDAWLSSTRRVISASLNLDISRRCGAPPKFVHKVVPVQVDAFRMRLAPEGPGPEVLAHVRLLVESR
jgi:hypothetical protein